MTDLMPSQRSETHRRLLPSALGLESGSRPTRKKVRSFLDSLCPDWRFPGYLNRNPAGCQRYPRERLLPGPARANWPT